MIRKKIDYMLSNKIKNIRNNEWFRVRLIGAFIILMILLITVIIGINSENTNLYLEGVAKSITLLDTKKQGYLLSLYNELNKEFENEILACQRELASRVNKRGDKINYGVNGIENLDTVVNSDYQNGLESIIYVKGKDTDRKDGESNFLDMLAFMSSILGADIDKYDDKELEDMFTKVFKLTHTFSGNATDLYSCTHGCSWTKYYCGDFLCVNGNLCFYKSDLYMGDEKSYGLMYDPYIIEKTANYYELEEYASDEKMHRTSYEYNVIEVSYTDSANGPIEKHKVIKNLDTVYSDNNEIYGINEYEGVCIVCSGGKEVFSKTTKKFAGCMSNVSCYHGASVKKYNGEDDEVGHIVDWCLERNKKECDNFSIEEANCSHICECEDECTHTCADTELLDTGYYVCLGHPHYACPGHIAVTCFGHTNLMLEIKIMYIQEMLNSLGSEFIK